MPHALRGDNGSTRSRRSIQRTKRRVRIKSISLVISARSDELEAGGSLGWMTRGSMVVSGPFVMNDGCSNITTFRVPSKTQRSLCSLRPSTNLSFRRWSKLTSATTLSWLKEGVESSQLLLVDPWLQEGLPSLLHSTEIRQQYYSTNRIPGRQRQQ